MATARTKRKRVITNPLEKVSRKSDQQFVMDYLQPSSGLSSWLRTWQHPERTENYRVDLLSPGALGDTLLDACLSLVTETSQADYESSKMGWDAAAKRREMQSPGLRYIVVHSGPGEGAKLCGFTSFMPTFEEGQAVVYCYEIHLKPDCQGTGLGRILMEWVVAVANNIGPPIETIMLTCFLTNRRGLAFYKKMGFVKDAISPEPRKLRFGKTINPDFVILSKLVQQKEIDPKKNGQETACFGPDSVTG